MLPIAIFGFDWTLELTYIACAAAGGTVLVLQTSLMLIGVGDGDSDVDLQHDAAPGEAHDGDDSAFNLLSVRALAAFFTLFGLAGWYGTAREWPAPASLTVAFAVGAATMVAVGWLQYAQGKLQSRGNLDPENALGLTARVYLRIPGENAGFGKITAKVQGRTAEFSAFTLGEALPTGALVKIARMSTPDTFEVVALKEERT